MAPWQRNVSIRLNNAWDARWVTNFASGTTRRSALWQNNATEVKVATAGKAVSTSATTTSGRIAVTAVVVTTMTNATRNGRTRLPLIAVTRRSSHARCMGQIASTPLRSAKRTPRMTNINFKTKNLITKHITMMRATRAKMTSRALALIHRSQVRIQRQPWVRARKPTRVRIIIFMLIKKWRQVAMCLVSLNNDSKGPSPSQVKSAKKEKRLILF